MLVIRKRHHLWAAYRDRTERVDLPKEGLPADPKFYEPKDIL